MNKFFFCRLKKNQQHNYVCIISLRYLQAQYELLLLCVQFTKSPLVTKKIAAIVFFSLLAFKRKLPKIYFAIYKVLGICATTRGKVLNTCY